MKQPIFVLSISVMCLLLLTAQQHKVWAQTQAADKLYQNNCMKCHGPKTDKFARKKLTLNDGVLVGSKSNRPVKDVLTKHFGVRLSQEETNALLEALRQHLSSRS